MRALWSLLLCLTLAGPALARQEQATPASAEQAGLRGAASAGQGASVQTPAVPPIRSASSQSLSAALAFTRPLASTASTGSAGRPSSQCRKSCAQSLYFCLSASDDISCNARWARCAAGCS